MGGLSFTAGCLMNASKCCILKTKPNKIAIEHNKGVLPVFETLQGLPWWETWQGQIMPGLPNWKTHFYSWHLNVSSSLPCGKNMAREGCSPGPSPVMHEGCPLLPQLLGCPDQPHKKILRRWDSCILLWRFSSVKSTIKLNSIPFLEQTERNLLKWKIQNENSGTAIKSEF